MGTHTVAAATVAVVGEVGVVAVGQQGKELVQLVYDVCIVTEIRAFGVFDKGDVGGSVQGELKGGDGGKNEGYK